MNIFVLDIEDKNLTPFVLAMPNKYRYSDVVDSYRAYYIGEKRDIVTWKNKKPDWWK